VVSAERVAAGRFSDVRRSAAQHRVLDAALILIADHEPFQHFLTRLYGVLLGDADADAEGRVSAAMLSGAIGTAVVHPLVTDIDDDELRAQLMVLTRRLLDLPE
jgi:hypothetical protein